MKNKFKQSIYNYFFNVDNNEYIYNLLSTAIVQVNSEISENLKANKINKLSNEIKTELFNQGFLVESDADEKEMFEYYYNTKIMTDTSNVMRVTLFPTLSCNLACPYCFEGQNKANKKISKSNIDILLKFVEKYISDRQNNVPIKKLYFSFFGGEPMLCKNEIKIICENVKNITEKWRIKLFFDITSNFTLLNDEFFELIKQYKIEVQVTIDGTKEEHDTRRITHDGKGTYDLIINNLKKAVQFGIKDLITIRINLDENNLDSADEIIKPIKEFSNTIYFSYLMKFSGANDNYKNGCMDCNTYSSIATTKLYEVYEKNGLKVPIEFGKKTPCPVNAQNCFNITPDLSVYKCESLINNPECKVGFIDNNGNFVPNSVFYHFMNYSPLKLKCKNCKMLPMCAGGCPVKEYINRNQKNGKLKYGECYANLEDLKTYLVDYVKRNTK